MKLKQRRFSTFGDSVESTGLLNVTDEFENNFSQEECQNFKNKLVQKSNDLQSLCEEVNEEVSDFKTKITQKFSPYHINKGILYLAKVIEVTKSKLDFWQTEINEWECSFNNESDHFNDNLVNKKKKFNLSIRRKCNSETNDEMIDDDITRVDTTTVNKDGLSSSTEIIGNLASLESLSEMSNVNKDVKENDGEKNNFEAVLENDDSCNSSDSIFSHTTQVISNHQMPLSQELNYGNVPATLVLLRNKSNLFNVVCFGPEMYTQNKQLRKY